MKSILSLLSALVFWTPLKMAGAEELEIEKGSTTAGGVDVSWNSQLGYTYFLKMSEDMVSWDFVPLIESGDGSLKEYGFHSSSDKLFLQLVSTDQDDGGDPLLADFDGDNLSNWEEVREGGTNTNPFEEDSNGDGIRDDGLVYAAVTNPDGLGLPAALVGSTNGVIGRWDAEIVSFQTPPQSPQNGFWTPNAINPAYPMRTAPNPDSLGMVSKALDHSISSSRYAMVDGNILSPHIQTLGQNFSTSFWFRIPQGTIENQTDGIYKSVWALTENTGSTVAGDALLVRKWNNKEQWFLGGYIWNINGGAPVSNQSGDTHDFDVGTHDDGEWHHATIVREGTQWRLHIDGVKVMDFGAAMQNYNFYSLPSSPGQQSTLILQGRFYEIGTQNHIPLDLDRMRLYGRSLSSPEALSLYHQDTDGDGLWDIAENRTMSWADLDGDTIWDSDETQYVANPFYYSEPDVDHDRDGLSSLFELGFKAEVRGLV